MSPFIAQRAIMAGANINRSFRHDWTAYGMSVSGTCNGAPDGKRIAVLIPVETPDGQQSQNHGIFLENLLTNCSGKYGWEIVSNVPSGATPS